MAFSFQTSQYNILQVCGNVNLTLVHLALFMLMCDSYLWLMFVTHVAGEVEAESEDEDDDDDDCKKGSMDEVRISRSHSTQSVQILVMLIYSSV